MRVLTHLENLNLATLQLHILNRHLLLGHDFNGDSLARLLVDGRLDEAELALAERLLDLVEIEDVGVTNDRFDGGHPTLLFGAVREVVASSLVGREDELEGVQHGGAVKLFLSLILDEHANERVHALVLFLAFVLVDVKLLAQEAVPILLKLGLSGLADHLTLDLNRAAALVGLEGGKARRSGLA